MNDILLGLNPNQKEAVMATEGPVLIIAGAGSGKTKTLTHRIAYLIQEKNIQPQRILAVTFTNKAAGEMKNRVARLLNVSGSGYNNPHLPTMGTFHNISAKILRREIEMLGYKKSFNIFDDQDQVALIKKIIKKLALSPDQFTPYAFLDQISKAKNQLIDAETYALQAGSFYEEIGAKVYSDYQKELKTANALDFDDLIMLTVKILRRFPEIKEKYQRFFQYIMVDEYQDTNQAQYSWVNLLAEKNRNLCVVGDDWQCFPKGTQILNSATELVNIENTDKKNSVIAGAGQGEYCEQKILKNRKSKFNGQLVKITTQSGKEIMATPNHIFFANLSLIKDIFYVYLMFKKHVGYRIGMAKGMRTAKSQLGVGLNVRANQERADRMWILKVCRQKSEAQYWEQYLAFFYGIPTTLFPDKNNTKPRSRIDCMSMFKNIDTNERVKKIFQDFELNFDYPHHSPQATTRNSIKRASINFTMFSDHRKGIENPWAMHRISINSNDKRMRLLLEKSGLKTRNGKGGWRSEIARKNYAELELILEKIEKILPDSIVMKKASLTDGNTFLFQPASHLRETMTVPVWSNGKIVDDKIVKVERVEYDGPVYDLDVANVHNYIANGIAVHNSIYGWRGANIQNILNFEKDYPEAKVIKLDQNYRSTQVILDAAYGVISKNVNRKEKKLWTEKQEGELVVSFEAQDERDEAEFAAREILDAVRGGRYRYSDFAIFYRTNAQSRMVEEVFLKRSIPYRIIGGIRFYQRKEVKDVIAYLRLIQNFSDLIALERVINEPRRGIGAKTLGNWLEFAKTSDINPIRGGLKSEIQNYKSETNSKFKISNSKFDEIAKFCDFIIRMNEAKNKLPLSDFVQKVVRESGYEKWILDGTTEGEVRFENVLEIMSVAKKYDTEPSGIGLEMFLEEVALVSDTDNIDQEKEAVHLMTLHSAKGLEFPIIFIIGLEEGILPHSRSMLSASEMEEERRLMYVGITRAKEKVHLIHANQRTIFGSTQINAPSRFLDDIPTHLMAETHTPEDNSMLGKSLKFKTQSTKHFGHQSSSHRSSGHQENKKIHNTSKIQDTNFKGGEHVHHPEFGDGLVVGVDGDIATIAFKQKGIKKMSLSFSPLKKI